jgi:hypothetical protein
VPIDNAVETTIGAFRSADGGGSWTDVTAIATIHSHTEGGSLRAGPLPSAEIDAAGRVYLVWSDCRFRRGCRANDIVLSTSGDGVHWSAVTRVPIDAAASAVDHFIPGLAVDRSTSGIGAHLGLTYYFYPVSSCGQSTCQLDVGFISSTTGAATWHPATMLAGPMSVTWLPTTTQGFMVGDYISTSFSDKGLAHGVFAVASQPSASIFHEAMHTNTIGLASTGAETAGEVAASDVLADGDFQAGPPHGARR